MFSTRCSFLALLVVALPLLAHAAAPASSAVATDSGSSALVFPSASPGSQAHNPVDLTSATFFDLVLDSRQGWIVAFVAPWCGHCRALEEPFAAASRAAVSAVRFGRVDCTVQTSLAAQFHISSYPTVMIFPPGSKKPKLIRKYEGGRDQRSLSDAANALLNLKSIKRLSSAASTRGGGGSDTFPASFVSFFAGRSQTAWSASLRPSLLVFLHAHKPSPELQGLSQAFQNRVNFGVVEKSDKPLRRLMRVTSDPTFFACISAHTTRTNSTGTIECMRYEHADKDKGSGVNAVSKFLVDFIAATTTTTATTAADASATGLADARRKYPTLKRFVIDEDLAKESGADAAAAASSEAAVPLVLPPPLQSIADFHARCTDMASGVCLLIFAEPSSASAAGSPLAALFASIASWNQAHAARRSFKVSPLLVPTSSVAAAVFISLYSIPLDSSALGVTLLALLPSRNRFVPYDALGAFRANDAAQWIESVARDEQRVRPQKLANMQEKLRTAMKERQEDSEGASMFLSTSAVAAATPVHEEL